MPRAALVRKPLPKPSPDSDPRYRKVMEQLKAGAAKTKAHPPASKKAADAAAASKGPPNERAAGGKAKQVDKIKDAKEGKPEQSSFLAMLRAEIAKVMPKTLGQTENFDSTAQQMKGGLKGNVAEQKEKSTQDVSGASKQTPGPAGEAKAEKPLPPDGAPAAPAVNAAEGMPAPKSEADVSLQDSKQDADAQLKEAEVTPTSLQKANDPRFSAVLTAKQEVVQNADAGPGKYRAAEAATLAGAAASASSATKAGAAAMIGVRKGGNSKVLTRQQEQKAKDEAKRKAVVDKIEAIYNTTKARVDAKLAAVDGEVNGMFDRGTDAALNAMTNFVNGRIRDYKIKRYLSIPLVGLARWIRDQVLNLPDEVNVFYDQGRQLFQAQMDALIVRVANLVEQRLKEAKAEVAKGQAEIKAFVASQPKDLQAVAQQAQTAVASRFEELEKGIEEKKNALAQSLAQKYKEGFDKANEALKAIQDSNKGALAGLAEKLGEVIKALMEFKARLMGILRKGEETIKLILADPIGFVGNLISAVKGGISAFLGNIKTHLANGFKKWLFGNLPPGVEIPADFSLVSIFKLVMGVLGITAAGMRAKAVKLIGERNMKIIEKVIEYVVILIRGGPAALWEKVKEDLSNLKDMVIEAIKSWLIDTIVKQAVTKILSMFNPAGAILQAILAIYNVIIFVVEKAAQIMEFVESVINSIHAIATGSIGGAIAKVEQALGNAVPILIGFLARLIGLGGIAQKIRDFIAKVQAKVDAAIDKAIAKIVAFVKKLFGKGGAKEAEAGGELKDAVYKKPFSIGSGGHTVTAKLQGGKLQVSMASAEAELIGALRKAIATVSGDEKREKSQRQAILGHLNPALAAASSIEQEWLATGARDPRGGDKKIVYEKFMQIHVVRITNNLQPLAKYKLTDLEHILSRPKKRSIPSGFNIRKRLYDAAAGSWTASSKAFRDTKKAAIGVEIYKIWTLRATNPALALAQWNAAIAAGKLDPKQIPTFSSYNHPSHFPNFKYETDHKKSLGEFWNGGENDQDDGARSASCLLQTNWQLLTKSANAAKSGVDFKREVGENFTSAVANSPKGSATIGGTKFEEA
jgi:hypothetical protein